MTILHEIIRSIDSQLLAAQSSEAVADFQDLLHTKQDPVRKYVLISIGENRLALPIDGLTEVGTIPPITRLPNLPQWVKGIINQRGEIVSVVDFEELMNINISEKRGNRLAVLFDGTTKTGIILDQVVATITRTDSECKETGDSILANEEPEVFAKSLEHNSIDYIIIQPDAFLSMDRLMHYYASE